MNSTKGELTAQPVYMWGDLADVHLVTDLIGFLQQSGRTAALTVTRGQTRKTLFFHENKVHAASSNVPEDRLGNLLLRSGQIDRPTLDAALAETSLGHKLGNVLIEKGVITPKDLWNLIRLQIEEICYSMVLFDQGEFIVGGYDIDEIPTHANIPADQLLLDVLRRQDEMRDATNKLPPRNTLLTRLQNAPQNLNAAERMIYEMLETDRSIEEICDNSELSPTHLTMALYHLMKSGVIGRAAESDPA